MTQRQLYFFEESEDEILHREIREMRALAEKTRKSQYHKIAEAQKIAREANEKIDTLILALCRTKNNDFADLPLFTNKGNENG